MPELPEVETVKNSLIKRVLNRRILYSDIYYDKIIAYPDVLKFKEEISNKCIIDISRRGKFILFDLDEYYLISHLRMEGKFFIKNSLDSLSKHDHVIFKLDNNQELRYNDTRKFGKMYLVKKDELSNSPLLSLGLEPWDSSLTAGYLLDKLNKNKSIKTLLLDQSIICGIGNIYADEILFLCKINPYLKGMDLTLENCQDIIKYTKMVFEKSIELGGTTIHTYTSVDGVMGRNQQELLVHGRVNLPCCNCSTKIIKVVINGRGTYYCSNCQK